MNITFTKSSTEQLVATLQAVSLINARSVRPYAIADISIETVPIPRIIPLANYILSERIKSLRALQEMLVANSFSLFDLDSCLSWSADGQTNLVSPPVIEDWPNEGLLLVDGLHRAWLARSSGVEEVTCAVIRGVSTPLVPRPTAWENVVEYPVGTRPSSFKKRNYRFHTRDAVCEAIPGHADLVTEDNYTYFFYRDLSSIGSRGIRETSVYATETRDE